MLFVLALLYSISLFEIEIGVIAFIATIVVITISVFLKILKNKKLQRDKS